MNENKKGYWVYSVITVIVFVVLFAFLGYLLYDLVLKLSEKDFSNNTVIQALITLVITVFIGGYFSKWLEQRNYKKIELYKIQTQLSITLIDLSSAYLWDPNNNNIKQALLRESVKVKLYFDSETLKKLNAFIQSDNKQSLYDPLIDELKKQIK